MKPEQARHVEADTMPTIEVGDKVAWSSGGERGTATVHAVEWPTPSYWMNGYPQTVTQIKRNGAVLWRRPSPQEPT